MMKEHFREELLDKAGFSIYKLVMLVTKRAIEIAEGAPNWWMCRRIPSLLPLPLWKLPRIRLG